MHDLHPVITRYLTHQMDAAERQDFEARLRADPELAAEVVFYETLRHQHDQDLRKQWQTLGMELLDSADSVTETPPATLHVTHRRQTFIWAAAASLALALTAAGFWWYQSQQSFGEKLYARQYTALEESSGTLGVLPAQDVWAKAYQLYQKKQYDQARQQASTLLGQENETDRAHLLIGLCWLESGHAGQAQQELLQVRPAAIAYYWPARFGLAFAYLHNNELDQAATVLRDISQHADTPNARKKAEDLLRALGKH